jgi:hypothetical protein
VKRFKAELAERERLASVQKARKATLAGGLLPIDLGLLVDTDIFTGEDKWYEVTTNMMIRAGANLDTATRDEVQKGWALRVDKMQEVEGKRMRSHVAEPRSYEGWVSAKFLKCLAGREHTC